PIRGARSDAPGHRRPPARPARLISHEPQTQETRRIVTSIDGTADVRLRPGRYVIESDQPIALEGKAYRHMQGTGLVAGQDSSLELTIANAVGDAVAPGTNSDAPLTTD